MARRTLKPVAWEWRQGHAGQKRRVTVLRGAQRDPGAAFPNWRGLFVCFLNKHSTRFRGCIKHILLNLHHSIMDTCFDSSVQTGKLRSREVSSWPTCRQLEEGRAQTSAFLSSKSTLWNLVSVSWDVLRNRAPVFSSSALFDSLWHYGL